MKTKWIESSAFAVVMCFIAFPIGLVLIGANQKIKWLSKVLISITYILIILVFFTFYQPILRNHSPISTSASTENIQYKINRFYTKETLVNGLAESVKPTENEIFLCVDLEVTNLGTAKVFFISLVDDPKIETATSKHYPDLTLSQEPFGEINGKQTLFGFLVFRIPKDEKPLTFRISNLSRNIDF